MSLNKLFSFNCPTLFIGDLNAHHHCFQNMGKRKYPDIKGKQAFTLLQNRNLNFLGPNFYTFYGMGNKGMPDVVIGNDKLIPFNHLISQGSNIGSDHIPIIMKIQIKPFAIIKELSPNVNSLNLSKYREALKNLEIKDLNNLPKEQLDVETEKLVSSILTATKNNCNPHKVSKIKLYEPTTEIVNKLKEYQKLCKSNFLYGYPRFFTIQNKLEEIITLIKTQKNSIWNKIIQLACECYGDPGKFWKRFKLLMGGKKKNTGYLKVKKVNVNQNQNLNQQLSDEDQYEIIEDSREQANIMSSLWNDIFQDHEGAEFNNENTRMVENWFNSICNNLTQSDIIHSDQLPPDHPLRRPINITELNNAIVHTKDKTPGPSNISLKQIKYLPINCKHIIINIYKYKVLPLNS